MFRSFEYLRVSSVEEGCRALADARQGALLAGGTDLLVQIRSGAVSPDLLVDGKRIEEWSRLAVSDQGVEIGANVSLARLVDSRRLREICPALCSAAEAIGTATLRNRATLAGNICNASPAADAAPVLLVQGATVEVTGSRGARQIPISEFFHGVRKTALRRDEIVTSIAMRPTPGLRTAFHKQQRIRGHDLAVVNVAGTYCPDSHVVRMAVGSCAPIPVLLPPIEAGGMSRNAIADRVMDAARQMLSPISDVRAASEYRWAVLGVLVQRVTEDLLGGGSP